MRVPPAHASGVIGATGNVGTSVLPALVANPRVTSVLGVARRLPQLSLPKVAWAAADVSSSNLIPLLRGADVVVHLAWLIQPSHDGRTLAANKVRRAVGAGPEPQGRQGPPASTGV